MAVEEQAMIEQIARVRAGRRTAMARANDPPRPIALQADDGAVSEPGTVQPARAELDVCEQRHASRARVVASRALQRDQPSARVAHVVQPAAIGQRSSARPAGGLVVAIAGVEADDPPGCQPQPHRSTREAPPAVVLVGLGLRRVPDLHQAGAGVMVARDHRGLAGALHRTLHQPAARVVPLGHHGTVGHAFLSQPPCPVAQPPRETAVRRVDRHRAAEVVEPVARDRAIRRAHGPPAPGLAPCVRRQLHGPAGIHLRSDGEGDAVAKPMHARDGNGCGDPNDAAPRSERRREPRLAHGHERAVRAVVEGQRVFARMDHARPPRAQRAIDDIVRRPLEVERRGRVRARGGGIGPQGSQAARPVVAQRPALPARFEFDDAPGPVSVANAGGRASLAPLAVGLHQYPGLSVLQHAPSVTRERDVGAREPCLSAHALIRGRQVVQPQRPGRRDASSPRVDGTPCAVVAILALAAIRQCHRHEPRAAARLVAVADLVAAGMPDPREAAVRVVAVPDARAPRELQRRDAPARSRGSLAH